MKFIKRIYKKVNEKFQKQLKKITKEDVIIFLIPFVMFLFYWIIFYPGILSYDSHYQINEIMAGKFDTSHPFFHTFIEMVLMKIWNTPAVVGLFQISVFSILWTKICKYNRLEGKSISFFSQILVTIILVLNPLNKTMSITLWKDVLYSYSVLWLCFEVEKFIDKKFKLNFKNVLTLSFLLMLLPNLRHNGYIITVLMGIIILVLFIIHDRKSKNYLKFVGLIVVFFFSFKALERIYNVEDKLTVGDTAGVIDFKLLSLTGEIGRNGTVTNKEIEEVNKYANFDKLVIYSHYNVTDVIWLFCGIDGNIINANREDFYDLMKGMISKNKLITLEYLKKESSFIWRIVRYDDSFGIKNYYGINAQNSIILYKRAFQGSELLNAAIKYVIFSFENKLFQTVFYSGALYLYISIISFIILRIKYKVNYFLVLFPVIINLLGLLLTMPVNDVRYYYSNFMVCYLSLIILFRSYSRPKNEKK